MSQNSKTRPVPRDQDSRSAHPEREILNLMEAAVSGTAADARRCSEKLRRYGVNFIVEMPPLVAIQGGKAE